MRIFVAGASGVIGRQLLPLLVAAGHEVYGMARSPERSASIAAAGATSVIADALEPTAVMTAVRGAAPDVVVHQLTAIPARLNIRRFDRDFALTNRLRREGTVHLLAAAEAAGARLFVAQSFAGWPYAREGSPVKAEEAPLDATPPPRLAETLAAIKDLESRVAGSRSPAGIVLRYGALYGPGTSIGLGGSVVEDVCRRRIPIVGTGGGVWSFLHVEDAARATVVAIERARPGIYNVVDDDPAPVSEWLPALAAAVGANPPLRVPAWLARLAIGHHGALMMTAARGASNAKARGVLGWQPLWPSWRDGFRAALYTSRRASRANGSDGT